MSSAMGMPPLFLPEGHIDKALNRTLIAYHREFDSLVNRKQGASGVANEMKLQWNKHGLSRRVVGMVDADKRIFKIAYLAEFRNDKVRTFQFQDAAHTIFQHPIRTSQYLIMLDPACDTWVWQATVGAGLALAAYGLPTDRIKFVEFSKDQGKDVGHDRRILELLMDVRKANPALFADLTRFVAQIMDLNRPLP